MKIGTWHLKLSNIVFVLIWHSLVDPWSQYLEPQQCTWCTPGPIFALSISASGLPLPTHIQFNWRSHPS